MTTKTYWCVPHPILVHEYSDSPSVEEFMDEVERDIQRLDSAKRTVHLVVDWRRASSYPFNYDMITRISKLLRHPNLGYIFIMGMNPVLSFWTELYSRLTGLRWQKVETISQAVDAIASLESPMHD